MHVLLLTLVLLAGATMGDVALAQHDHEPACPAMATDTVTIERLNVALRRMSALTRQLAESESRVTGEPVAAIRERIEKDNP